MGPSALSLPFQTLQGLYVKYSFAIITKIINYNYVYDREQLCYCKGPVTLWFTTIRGLEGPDSAAREFLRAELDEQRKVFSQILQIS